MKHFVYLYFAGFFLVCSCVIETYSFCPQPDVPANGEYTPKQNKFDLGDKITYSCKRGFLLFGENRRTCNSNDEWSDYTPFCDHSLQLNNPSITNKDGNPSLLSRVIDGNSSNCFDWNNAKGEHLYVHLPKKIVIRIIRIFLKKGIKAFQIFTGVDNDMKLCRNYENFIETDRWITIECVKNALTVVDTVKILVTKRSSITVCEIEVYGKEDDDCDQPPTMVIPNGYFEVSRSTATLICEKGYRSEYSRLVCEEKKTWTGGKLRCDEILCSPSFSKELSGGKWTLQDSTKKLSVGTKSKLICNEGYRKIGVPDFVICQQNGTWTKTNVTCTEKSSPQTSVRTIIFGVVGIVIVLLIIALLGTIIHFIRKQRNKEVVVVYHPQTDGSIPISASEMEYAPPRYEPLPSKPPELPSSPRPDCKLSTVSRGGNIQSEDWKNTVEVQAVPPDITFGTMKASTIYGS